MLLTLVILTLLIANWIFSNLFGFFPEMIFNGLEWLLKYTLIAVIILLFSWGFGD
jgi:hypothetical protein